MVLNMNVYVRVIMTVMHTSMFVLNGGWKEAILLLSLGNFPKLIVFQQFTKWDKTPENKFSDTREIAVYETNTG